MSGLLHEQVALITGGTAGIGKAIAMKFAEAGAKVAVFGTNIERGESIVHEINERTKKDCAAFWQVNVADTSAVDLAIKGVQDRFSHIDILINNAGITRDQLLMRMSEEDWDQVMDVNVKSCYNTTKALVRSFMKARKGKIVNITSVVGLVGNAGQANYAASKAAIIGFSKALAKELAPRNICVNCVAPGFIETGMTDALNDDQQKTALSQIPLSRMGLPDEIANAVLFLASPLANYITGQVLVVDGGMAM